MNDFRTPVSINASTSPISLKSKILTTGSCFADAIGSRLESNKFSVCINPFGVSYNPHSIHKTLLLAIHNEPASEHSYVHNNDLHLNFDFHSSFSAMQKKDLTENLNNTVGSVHYFLKDTDRIMITYGTAWVYTRTDTGEIVANCHKVPASAFHKRLLSESEIIESFETLYSSLKKFNPRVKIILTVSPVRHIKDTLELNSVSKSVIRVACHHIVHKFSDVDYFPGYEIMMDDLRDYRFYKDDLIHPTEMAEEYIWGKFIERYVDNETKQFITEWKSIQSALSHKPFHPQSNSHQQFLKNTLSKLELLSKDVEVSGEIARIKEQLLD